MIDHNEFDELEAMVDGTMESSEFVGDILDENPNQDTTRIYIQNINGLCWNKEGGKWPYICEVMAALQVDIACFSEINTDTNRFEVRKTMESICHKHFDKNSLVMATSSVRTTTTYKPGGTAILACNSITTRICTHTRDRLGRWTSFCLQTSPTKRLRIISAYQVCHQSKPGTNTAASQQIAQSILERSEGSLHNSSPRQLFIHEIHNFIKQSQKNGELIILAGDFNDDITQDNSGMNTIATACGLIDYFSIKLGTSSIPSTYQRGSKRLDYVLMSPELLDIEVQQALKGTRRFAMANVWRSIDRQSPVLQRPLACMDANHTVIERLRKFSIIYADRVGENYLAVNHAQQRWFYFPEMTHNEAMLLKQWDSYGTLAKGTTEEEFLSTFALHSAFVDPSSPIDAPPRESIEVRCIILYPETKVDDNS